jgi:hypothetical protein
LYPPALFAKVPEKFIAKKWLTAFVDRVFFLFLYEIEILYQVWRNENGLNV